MPNRSIYNRFLGNTTGSSPFINKLYTHSEARHDRKSAAEHAELASSNVGVRAWDSYGRSVSDANASRGAQHFYNSELADSGQISTGEYEQRASAVNADFESQRGEMVNALNQTVGGWQERHGLQNTYEPEIQDARQHSMNQQQFGNYIGTTEL